MDPRPPSADAAANRPASTELLKERLPEYFARSFAGPLALPPEKAFSARMSLSKALRALSTWFRRREYRDVGVFELPVSWRDFADDSASAQPVVSFVSAHGSIAGLAFEQYLPASRTASPLGESLRNRRWLEVWTRIARHRESRLVVEFQSRLNDGTALITSNRMFTLSLRDPIEVDRHTLPDQTDVGQLLDIHLRRLRARVRDRSVRDVMPLETQEAVRDFWLDTHERLRIHREAMNWIEPGELIELGLDESEAEQLTTAVRAAMNQTVALAEDPPPLLTDVEPSETEDIGSSESAGAGLSEPADDAPRALDTDEPSTAAAVDSVDVEDSSLATGVASQATAGVEPPATSEAHAALDPLLVEVPAFLAVTHMDASSDSGLLETEPLDLLPEAALTDTDPHEPDSSPASSRLMFAEAFTPAFDLEADSGTHFEAHVDTTLDTAMVPQGSPDPLTELARDAMAQYDPTLGVQELAQLGLAQGAIQIEAVGRPMHPMLIDEFGRFHALLAEHDERDPMKLAKSAIWNTARDIRRAALVLDAKHEFSDGKKWDAIVVMVCERGNEQGQTWAQRYQSKTLFKKFKIQGEPEVTGTSSDFISLALDSLSVETAAV